MPPLKKGRLAVGRREVLAGIGAVGLGVGLGKVSHWFPLASPNIGPDWIPGREERIASTCVLCPSHCGIRGRLVDGNLVAIEGNPLHPVSQGGLCPKGKAGLQMLYHPARVTTALERDGSGTTAEFASVEWKAVLGRVADKLRSLRGEGRPESVVWLGGAATGGMHELIEGFLRSYGTPHHVREDYADGSEHVMRIAQGIDARPAFDLERADLVVSFGAALAEAWWSLPYAASARIVGTNTPRRWLQVDTRLSRTATCADEWFPVRPGAYGTLALSIAYVLLKEGLYDSEYVQQRVTGFEDWNDEQGNLIPGFRSLVLRYGRPDDVAELIGLSADRIVHLAKQFGRARSPLAVWDHVVSWSRTGLTDALAIHALNVLVGSIHRPGGLFIQDSPPFPTVERMAGAGSFPQLERTPLTAADWPERVLERDGPDVEVLFLYRVNPVASASDPEKVRRALARIPLIVSFSPFLDETAQLAHLVLPDHTYLERWEDAPAPSSVPYPVWGVVRPVVEPLHDTRSTGDVLLELASRIGEPVSLACPWSSMEELVSERGKALADAKRGSVFESEFRREELRELEVRGWWMPHGRDAVGFWERLRDSGGWFDPHHGDLGRTAGSSRVDGRIALFPHEARTKIAGAVPGLAAGFLPLDRGVAIAPPKPDDAERSEEYPLKLLPYRLMTLASGTTALSPWLLEHVGLMTATAWESWIEINPETGHRLGLSSGQEVRVRSRRGEFTARLRLFAGAQPGVVNAPYGLHSCVGGWGRLKTANPLAAVGNRRDPITGLPDWYSTRVRIEPV